MSVGFISEFGINMVAADSILLQDEYLSRIEEILASRHPEYHIYIIGSRPRIAFDPSCFEFTPEMIRGAFVVQLGSERKTFPFQAVHPHRGSA